MIQEIAPSRLEIAWKRRLPRPGDVLLAEREGKLLLRSYDALGENMRRWVRQTVREEYADADSSPEYRLFLQAKFPYILKK